MYKIFFLIVTAIIVNSALAQNSLKYFDITSYQPIKNFKEELAGTVAMKLSYTTKKEIVEIYIYKSRPTMGDAVQDFKLFWNYAAKDKPLPADNTLQQETRTDGAKMVAAVSGTQNNFFIVTTHTLQKTMVPVFITANTTKYNKQIEAFIDGLVFKELITTATTTTPIVTNTTTNPNVNHINKNAIPVIFKDKYITGTGIFSDYSYIIPQAGKSTFHQQYSNLIKIMNENTSEHIYPFWLDIFPLENTSGNLEVDAENMFAKYHPGFVPFIRSGGSESTIEWEKGVTIQGFDYLKVTKELIKKNDDGNNIVKLVDIVVIKVSNKVATISLEQHVDGFSYHDGGKPSLSFILRTLLFNNVQTPTVDFKKDLLGTWGLLGTNVATTMSYFGTNTFDWGGTFQTRRTKDAEYDYVYTTNLGGTGTYTLKGGILTETWKATNKVGIKLISPVQRKRNNEPWQSCLWMIRINSEDCKCDGLPCLTNFDRPYSKW